MMHTKFQVILKSLNLDLNLNGHKNAAGSVFNDARVTFDFW